MEVKQATNTFKRNSLLFKANIKVSFVVLSQIRNDSKNNFAFKKKLAGRFELN